MTPEEKIADLKANFDYVLEGKDLEIKELKDRLAEEVELHLHAEEYIKSLEQQIEKMKCCGNCKSVHCSLSSEIIKDGRIILHKWNKEKEAYCDVGEGAEYQLWEIEK